MSERSETWRGVRPKAAWRVAGALAALALGWGAVGADDVCAQEMGPGMSVEEANARAEDEEIVLLPPEARQGYFISLGGAGMVNVNQSTEDDVDTVYGSYYNLRLGQLVTEWLGFGLQFSGGFGEDGPGRWSVGFGGLQLDAHVVPTDKLAVRIGVGAGGLSATDAESRDGALKGTGGAYYSAGVSYDWFPFYDKGSGGFGVTPLAQAMWFPGALWDGYLFTVGVEMTWWSGLPKNQLDLPIDEAFTKDD